MVACGIASSDGDRLRHGRLTDQVLVWRIRSNIPERFGVLHAELLSQQMEILKQKMLHVLEGGGIVVVAQQRQFLALPRQVLLQANPRISGGTLVLIGYCFRRIPEFPAGPLFLLATFTRTLVSMYELTSTMRLTRSEEHTSELQSLR